MHVNDAIIGFGIIAISLWLIFTAAQFPSMPGVPYGANVFPQVVCGILIVAGCILVAKGVREVRAEKRLIYLEEWARRPRTWVNMGLVSGGLLFYVLASEALGFPITAFVILLSLLLVVRGRDHAVSSTLVAVAFPFVAYLIFANWLRVPLPQGPLLGLF